jgi:rhodanese-related sulfurtransferase
MFNLFKSIFGGKNTEEIKNLVAEGAIVIDVRTPQEFAGGHYPKAKNIPLDKIKANIDQIKKFKKPVVLCCASGMRSASAASQLKSAGIENVYDAGSWYNLN